MKKFEVLYTVAAVEKYLKPRETCPLNITDAVLANFKRGLYCN